MKCFKISLRKLYFINNKKPKYKKQQFHTSENGKLLSQLAETDN